MSDEDDADARIHAATPRKLQRAREKGDVPVSPEVVSAAVFAAFLAVCALLLPPRLAATGGRLAAMFDDPSAFLAAGGPNGGAVLSYLGQTLRDLLPPLLLLPAALALLGFVAQRSVTFAPSKIAPKLNRISPLKGAKQKYGREGLFAFAKSSGKLFVYAALLAWVVWAAAPRLIHMGSFGAGGAIGETASIAGAFLAASAAVMLGFGTIDLIWQRARFFERQKMSDRELRDEMKDSEGDPYQKQARRRRAQELAASGAVAETARADVVIVNPTRYAVALAWDRAVGTAPVCLCKGTDAVAARIREIAAEAGVPIRSDPPTARAIHASVDAGDEVRPEHYRAVAAAIRFADSMREASRRR